HAVEHPIYDVWLTDCKNPVVAATAPTVPEPPPAAAAPAAKPPAATPSRRSSQPAAPQLATEPAAARRCFPSPARGSARRHLGERLRAGDRTLGVERGEVALARERCF